MKTLSCGATRRRLQAFHDGELAVGEQIAVSAHLEWCPRCSRALEDIREVGSALQAVLPGRLTLSREDAAAFTGTVVNRLKAEDAASLLEEEADRAKANVQAVLVALREAKVGGDRAAVRMLRAELLEHRGRIERLLEAMNRQPED